MVYRMEKNTAHKNLWGRFGTRALNRPLLLSACLILALGLAHVALAGGWESPAWADTLVNPVARDSVIMAQAAALYQKNCSVCHGATGLGDGMMSHGMQPPPANFTEAPGLSEDSDGSIFWKISTGKKPMPSWKKDLTETQIWSLVDYVRKFQPPAAKPDILKTALPDTLKP